MSARTVTALFVATLLVAAFLAGCAGEPEPPAALPPPTGDRVLLIGVDAGTWDLLNPLIAAGVLPTFAHLVETGYSAKLISMEPSRSPALWTTIATGKVPAQHGIEGFVVETDDGEEVPVTTNLRRTETLWTIASRAERAVNVVGWYVTWPAEAIHGVMVSDRFTPDAGAELVGGQVTLSREHPGVYPPDLGGDLERFFVRATDFLSRYEENYHKLAKAYPVDVTRAAIAEHLLETRPADLTMVYLRGIDPTQHLFWKFHAPLDWIGPEEVDRTSYGLNRSRIVDYYVDTDALLANLLRHAGPRDTILIVSDHGAGPIEEYDPQKGISGGHRPEGILIAAGHHVRPAFDRSRPSIVDVAPTVLHLLGLPVARDMRGKVIEGLLDPDFLREHPVQTIATYEQPGDRTKAAPIRSEMDDAIKDRLRTLGYLE
jgi:predicted AlkP superfamily phosphohydrolase/phosphomutase